MEPYICTCGHWGFNILDGEIVCLGCKKEYPLKRFFRQDGKTKDHILQNPEDFNKRIRKEAGE